MSACHLGLLTIGVTFTPMPPELATGRFILTRETLADAAWLADLFTARGGSTVTEAEARSRVAAMHELTSTHGIGAYVLRPRAGGAPAGYVAIIIGRGTVEESEITVASRHQRIRPHTPRHNGKVERYNRILAEELLYARIWTSEAERAAAIKIWNVHYNYHRPHTAAGDQPPASRLHAGVTNVMSQNT